MATPTTKRVDELTIGEWCLLSALRPEKPGRVLEREGGITSVLPATLLLELVLAECVKTEKQEVKGLLPSLCVFVFARCLSSAFTNPLHLAGKKAKEFLVAVPGKPPALTPLHDELYHKILGREKQLRFCP